MPRPAARRNVLHEAGEGGVPAKLRGPAAILATVGPDRDPGWLPFAHRPASHGTRPCPRVPTGAPDGRLPQSERIVITLAPVHLAGHGVELVPLALSHAAELAAAARDGRLWELWFTSVPSPEQVEAYIEDALAGQRAGQMLPWVVRELGGGTVVGTTRYHDVVPAIDRVEIGYTWYAAAWQRTHVNTACKRLLLGHAFDALGCQVVGLRTDRFNRASQRAIEALGAQRDWVLRHHAARRDGSARYTVMYSILAAEWPDVRRHLDGRMARAGGGAG